MFKCFTRQVSKRLLAGIYLDTNVIRICTLVRLNKFYGQRQFFSYLVTYFSVGKPEIGWEKVKSAEKHGVFLYLRDS